MRRSEVLAGESIQCLQEALARLRDIWELIGIPEEQRFQRTEVVKHHVKNLLDKMIAEEENLRERLLKSIAVCREELSTLCQELALESNQEEGERTILQLEKELRTQVELMRRKKKERKQELRDLQVQEQELCDVLCLPPSDIDAAAVPSLEQLSQFRQHLATLRETKASRREEFVNIKRQIILCMEELDHDPDTSCERELIIEDEDAFCLSLENIATLRKLLQRLEKRRLQNKAACEALRARLTELWDRLQVPAEEREAVTAETVGTKAKVQKALQLEVDRLEKLQRENLKKVIEGIRVELAQYWDCCFYGEEQRRAFAPYYQEDYTEDLLQLHDLEVGRLKAYYDSHRELFDGVKKWEETWQAFQDLENKASDPSRFTNRGGTLLKEEKQRAKLQKTLPKLEEELKVQIELWEQQHEREFVVKGQQFVSYVAEQWELYRLEKERAKQERQLKNKLEGNTPRTPSKRRGQIPTTPGKVRKLNATTLSGVAGTVLHSPALRMPPSGRKPLSNSCSGKKTPHSSRRDAGKENMEPHGSPLSGGYPALAPFRRNFSSNSVASTYSEFARELYKAASSDAASRILNSTTILTPGSSEPHETLVFSSRCL
ncbi:protein regulator of cytokinesis 1 [Suncus etruscus]|uniref:protein regulator of cytokinesis 1 n=1 Tax=Suncus etruscus TaxID=109475 RepID=UPI00210F5DD4|nr:protein regulator of cytokinesis 1 [Suncus etruscus]